MEFIAKEISLNNSAFNGKHICLCIFSEDTELLEMIVPTYPIVCSSQKKPIYTEINGKTHRVVAFISKDAKAHDGEVLIEDNLYWCDPKTLHYHSNPEYFPLKDYLYIENPSWIMGEVKIKRLVHRIL